MAHNLSQCRLLVQKAVAAGAKALFLPEASDYIAPTASETISLAQPASSSSFILGLQSSARDHKLQINVGIHEPTEDGRKVKNTVLPHLSSSSIIFDPRALARLDRRGRRNKAPVPETASVRRGYPRWTNLEGKQQRGKGDGDRPALSHSDR
ncbi:MAG: hypothetical protein L6R40_001200 [Gallowayella cf. fulva]|nr:MAG: hypothetical protein L6R40_001200 [Xanthomendoza cf. fulva]